MSFSTLNDDIVACRRCPRLVAFRTNLEPRKGRSRDDYWNRPVPGFGDHGARVCLVGLAPGAHGANRTGRPFTGDGAGDFMYPLLHQAGYASQAEAAAADDGLVLTDLYITNAVKCVPPENRPKGDEFDRCRPYLVDELRLLSRLQVVIGLGKGAFDSLVKLFQELGVIDRRGDYPFRHGACYRLENGLWLVGCYHTSRYNVQTGRIDAAMFLNLLDQVGQRVGPENG